MVSEVSGNRVERYSLISGDGAQARRVFGFLSRGYYIPVFFDEEDFRVVSSYFRLYNPWWVVGSSSPMGSVLVLLGFDWSPILTRYL